MVRLLTVLLSFTLCWYSDTYAKNNFPEVFALDTTHWDIFSDRFFRPFPNLDSTRHLCHIDEIHGTRPSNLPVTATGRNVLIGIIDTEFDTHHPAFLDQNGETRFVALWDQDYSSSLMSENRFGYGMIKNHEELQRDSLFGLRENHMHGTLMASIAAGSEKKYGYYGVAPDALIAAVKYSNQIKNISDGILWIFSLADSLNIPCVISLSIGISKGPHDGTSVFDKFVDSVCGPGKILVGAAGNDFNRSSHILFNHSPFDTGRTWIKPKDYVADSFTEYYCGVDIWGEQSKSFSVMPVVTDIKSNTVDTFEQVTTRRRIDSYSDRKLWKNSNGSIDTIDIQIAAELSSSLNSKSHCQIQFRTLNPNLYPGFLVVNGEKSQRIHCWHTEKIAFVNLNMDKFVNGDEKYCVNEIGGTSNRIISVGAYVSRSDISYWNDSIEIFKNAGDIAHFSGTGPTVDGRVKPDIVAPGMRVIAAMCRNAPAGDPPVIWPDISRTTGRYSAATGTSPSSPIVAGIIALMLEINPKLTTESARHCLQESAIKDQFTGNIKIPVNRWGAGKVNAVGAIAKMLGMVNTVSDIKIKVHASIVMFRSGRNVIVKNLNQKGYAMIFDLRGRRVARINFDESGFIRIPGNIASGLFTITAYGQNGTIAGNMKIPIDR